VRTPSWSDPGAAGDVAPGRTRSRRRVAARGGAIAVGVGLALLLAFPARVGVTGVVPVAQLIPFRAVIGLALAAVAALLLALPGRRRRLALVALVALAALLQAAVLIDRGVAQTGLPARASASDVVVLAANTATRASAADLAHLVRVTDADLAVFPETTRAVADDVAALLASSGTPMQVLAVQVGASGTTSTALLVRASLGTYRIDTVAATALATFVAVPVDGSGPTIVAVHPTPPSSPAGMAAWRSSTAWVTSTCRELDGAIVAGDFNSTLDHPAFAHLDPCLDAADAAGAAGLGSWPSSAPRLLAAPIDHVLADGRRWGVRSFAVLDAIAGSDHRPVAAVLRPR